MRRAILFLVAACVLVTAPSAAAAIPETPVLTSTRNEYKPAGGIHWSGDELLSYARSRPGQRGRYDAELRRTGPGGHEFETLNLRGQGFGGGIDESRVAYQQIVSRQSNVFVYDVDTGSRSTFPGVNTRWWEYGPTISGEWVLFTRQGPRWETRIMLVNTTTGAARTLDFARKRTVFLYGGQVAGNWAVWTRCAKTCDVFRYNIAARTRLRVPKPAGRNNGEQYAASVLPGGIVYLGRSGRGCGTSAKIVRFFGLADATNGTVVARLPRGRDLFNAYTRENPDGSADVFYDRGTCTRSIRWDVYKVSDPDPDLLPLVRTSRASASSATRAGESASGMNWLRSQPGSRSS